MTVDVETPRDTGEASSASRRDGDGIRLDGVTKVFGADVTAVDDVSLDIADGEFMVLVGPSGCGKSTLLRLIAGLEAVSAGRVFIGSADVTDVRPQDRDLAMVFQNYALYPHMTVAGNLAFGLRLRRLPKAERARRVLEVARKLGLEELLDRKPSELSGRAASAGRHGPRDGPRAQGVPDGRAALEPRREAARHHAGGARPAARAPRGDDRLRDARPDRGDDARSARGGAPGRCPAAGGHAAAPVPRARQPLRGLVHRLSRR